MLVVILSLRKIDKRYYLQTFLLCFLKIKKFNQSKQRIQITTKNDFCNNKTFQNLKTPKYPTHQNDPRFYLHFV